MLTTETGCRDGVVTHVSVLFAHQTRWIRYWAVGMTSLSEEVTTLMLPDKTQSASV